MSRLIAAAYRKEPDESSSGFPPRTAPRSSGGTGKVEARARWRHRREEPKRRSSASWHGRAPSSDGYGRPSCDHERGPILSTAGRTDWPERDGCRSRSLAAEGASVLGPRRDDGVGRTAPLSARDERNGSAAVRVRADALRHSC